MRSRRSSQFRGGSQSRDVQHHAYENFAARGLEHGNDVDDGDRRSRTRGVPHDAAFAGRPVFDSVRAMGDHEVRGVDSTRASAESSEINDDWRDEQITVVEKRITKTTTQGMPPLDRAPADSQQK